MAALRFPALLIELQCLLYSTQPRNRSGNQGAGNMELYHFCPVPLQTGSVILPGNWGRIIASYSMPENCNALVVRELLLENARLKISPDKPSRLEAVFSCVGRESMELFKKERPHDICYRVELCDEGLPAFTGSWAHVGAPNGSSMPMQVWHEIAEHYWSMDSHAKAPQTLELLSASPLRILGRA